MTSDARAIRFFNRYTGRMEEEAIYGEGFLRWAYETGPGRVAVAAIAKRALFSCWYGWRMSRPSSRHRIAPFIRSFGVDTREFADPVGSFQSFNDFFIRRLAPGARPIDPAPDAVVFPADGRHLLIPDIGAMTGFFIKGQRFFDLPAFLGDKPTAERFARGTLLLSRLCPVDYHRFHFPIAGRAGRNRLIDGSLFSVNPVALRRRLAILWENKRTITEIESSDLGTVAMVEIGATCVGTIVQSFSGPGPVAKGEEKGWFAFGGSSVVTLFEPGRFRPAADLLEWSAQGIELYARMGDRAGTAAGVSP